MTNIFFKLVNAEIFVNLGLLPHGGRKRNFSAEPLGGRKWNHSNNFPHRSFVWTLYCIMIHNTYTVEETGSSRAKIHRDDSVPITVMKAFTLPIPMAVLTLNVVV